MGVEPVLRGECVGKLSLGLLCGVEGVYVGLSGFNVRMRVYRV